MSLLFNSYCRIISTTINTKEVLKWKIIIVRVKNVRILTLRKGADTNGTVNIIKHMKTRMR